MFGDMSTSTYFDHGVYIELKPKESPKFTNIVYPLDVWTWMWLAIAFGVTALALHLIHLYEYQSRHVVMKTIFTTYSIIIPVYLTFYYTIVFCSYSSSIIWNNFSRVFPGKTFFGKEEKIYSATSNLGCFHYILNYDFCREP